MKFKRLDAVIIKKYKDDQYNNTGIIISIDKTKDKPYNVPNKNMPFMGIVNDWFNGEELECQ